MEHRVSDWKFLSECLLECLAARSTDGSSSQDFLAIGLILEAAADPYLSIW